MPEVICNKAGIVKVCNLCEHGRPHDPLQIDDFTCQKTDDCSLHINGKYQEIRVKCKVVK